MAGTPGAHDQANPHAHAHYVSAHNPHAGQGPVVLDIGEDVGALVLHVPQALVGTEIDISPAGHDEDRRHVEVLPRHLAHRTVYAAVYPDLTQGRWTVWGLDGQPVLVVDVPGGRVRETRWPDEAAG